MNRFIIFVLIVIAILSLVSCGGNNDNQNQEATQLKNPVKSTAVEMGKGKLSIYFSASDFLNPYEAESAGNQQLSTLLFDSLVKLEENLDAKLMMAQSIETQGKKCTINLRDIKFSDGSTVTSEDVTYSLKNAKASNQFRDQLKNISSFAAVNSRMVELTLEQADRFVGATLDFPIVKRGSTERENADNKKMPPVGAGRYIYNDDSGVYTLTGNKNYYGNKPENVIYLVNTPDFESLKYYLKINEVDIFYSGVNIENLPSMSGEISKVKQTNLIYLAINSKSKNLSNKYVRQSLSYLLNREQICYEGFLDYATPAKTLFNNSVSTKKIFSESINLEKSIEQLNKGGYNKVQDNGYYINNKNETIKLKLLYNKENHFQSSAAVLIEKQLKKGGIDVSLSGATSKNYRADVKNGRYDIYLGEVKLNKNFDLTAMFNSNLIEVETEPVTNDNTTQTGDNNDEIVNDNDNAVDEKFIDIAKVYSDYLAKKIETDEFLEQFCDRLPFIPIGYRDGIVTCSSGVSPKAIATISDAYYNIELLSVK